MAEIKTSISYRVNMLKNKAAERCDISEDEVHIGHIALQAMLDEPLMISQIDAATGKEETNKSVAKRSSRLASAMVHAGLKPGDPVIVMGHNHIDLCIPYFACHFGGHPMCSMDPSIGPNDLIKLFPIIQPKMVFCQKSCEEKVQKAFKANFQKGQIVIFDDKQKDINDFVHKYGGTHVHYRPALFDQSENTAWLMLTSGTTGLPKVAIIPYDTLLRGIINWWSPIPEKIDTCLAMATIQWLSSLLYFMAGPLKGYTRIQCSQPLLPQTLIAIINKYRPTMTAWTPFLLGQFLVGADKLCDFSCFKYIIITGSPMDKQLLDKFKQKCSATLFFIYGMTELLAPIFDCDENTPFGSAGTPQSQYEFRLMDENGKPLQGPLKTGELWVKGNGFFKGYLNNPEDTRTMLTEDGWFKTGDMFYRDAKNFYYFVERKRLLIKHYGFMISPWNIEEIIKRHPSVADVCAVGLPDPNCLELPVLAVLRRNGDTVDPKEVFELLRNNLEFKQFNAGIFFVEALPVTASGKIHRAKVKELALTAQKILF